MMGIALSAAIYGKVSAYRAALGRQISLMHMDQETYLWAVALYRTKLGRLSSLKI
jgi:hypothetical protein